MPSLAPFEIPAEMRAFVERSLEQAKLAFGKFMDAAQSTMNTFEGQSNLVQTGAKEVAQKIKGFAEQNVATAFDQAQKLVQAKDAQTLLTLHGELVQSQMQLLSEQARALGEISSKAAMDPDKPKSLAPMPAHDSPPRISEGRRAMSAMGHKRKGSI